jgi:DNA-binding CsgD family transcriptional regulator
MADAALVLGIAGLMLVALFLVSSIVNWGAQTVRCNSRSIPAIVLLSFGLHIAYTTLLLLLKVPMYWCWLFCPIVSGACLATRSSMIQPQERNRFNQLKTLPWAILLPCTVFVLIGVILLRLFVGPTMPPAASDNSRLITLLTSAVILLCVSAILRFTKKSSSHFPSVAFLAVCLVAAFIVVIIFVESQMRYCPRIIVGVEHFIEVYIWFVLAASVKEKKLSIPLVFAAYSIVIVALPQFIASDLLQLTGILNYFQSRITQTTLASLLALCAFIIVIPSMFFNFNQTIRKASRNNKDLEEQAFTDAAHIGGLTSREREIMVLLYRNRSAEMIAGELVIAKSTVNSHIKHIYLKFSIHSRQQLASLIDSYKADS